MNEVLRRSGARVQSPRHEGSGLTEAQRAGEPATEGFASPFPPSQRVIYERNPLESVICQLRVPANLRIDVETPAAFQQAIRAEYPTFKQVTNIVLPTELPEEVRTLLAGASPIPTGTAFDFVSEDGDWTVGLTREFLALTARTYRRWEEFKDRLAGPLAAFLATYEPAYFTRVGLRYQDVIRPSALGLEGRDWADLLQDHIAAELVNRDISHRTLQATRDLVFDLGDGQRVHLKHGIARRAGDTEDSYLIDADFFTEERKSHDEALRVLDEFHSHAGRLFRWCITDLVHDSLGPEPI